MLGSELYEASQDERMISDGCLDAEGSFRGRTEDERHVLFMDSTSPATLIEH